MEKLYTLQEVADILRLHYRTVRLRCARGQYHSIRLGSRGYRIAQSELDRITGLGTPPIAEALGARLNQHTAFLLEQDALEDVPRWPHVPPDAHWRVKPPATPEQDYLASLFADLPASGGVRLALCTPLFGNAIQIPARWAERSANEELFAEILAAKLLDDGERLAIAAGYPVQPRDPEAIPFTEAPAPEKV